MVFVAPVDVANHNRDRSPRFGRSAHATGGWELLAFDAFTGAVVGVVNAADASAV
jgi:hypothetical protein